LGLLALVGVGVVAMVDCGSSGGVASGGSCYNATDCNEGLYCYGVTINAPGMCTSDVDKAQPPSDAAYPDGGDVPEDGIHSTDAKTTTPPVDTGTKAPPVDSGGGGS
jgi:hypothetical protein